MVGVKAIQPVEAKEGTTMNREKAAGRALLEACAVAVEIPEDATFITDDARAALLRLHRALEAIFPEKASS